VRFSYKRQDGSVPNFLSRFVKHLFITTCIEKQCTWPLTSQVADKQYCYQLLKLICHPNYLLVSRLSCYYQPEISVE